MTPTAYGRTTTLLLAYSLLGLAARLTWGSPHVAVDVALLICLAAGIAASRRSLREFRTGHDIPFYLLVVGVIGLPLGTLHPLASMVAVVVMSLGLTACLFGLIELSSRWAPRTARACYFGIAACVVFAMIMRWSPEDGMMLLGAASCFAACMTVAWLQPGDRIAAALQMPAPAVEEG